MVGREDHPWVAFPERLDRRLRLGPFASGREAVKFVTATAVAAVVSLAVSPWAGVPVLAVGALLALWRPGGEALDERLSAVARWSVRQAIGTPKMTRRSGPRGNAAATVDLGDGRWAAAVQTGGTPLAFLPPEELARQFDRARELVRAVDGGLIVHVASVPMHGGALVPKDAPFPPAERAAWDGYVELVRVLAQRRSLRRVVLVLIRDAPAAEGRRSLETSAALLEERLLNLGLRPARLKGRALSDAARRLGLGSAGATA